MGNPFAGCGVTWLAHGGVGAALQPALGSALPPDALLACARDSAPDLAARLSIQQIHEMVSELISLHSCLGWIRNVIFANAPYRRFNVEGK